MHETASKAKRKKKKPSDDEKSLESLKFLISSVQRIFEQEREMKKVKKKLLKY